MRLNLRLVDRSSEQPQDIVLIAEPEMPMVEVAAALNTVMPGTLYLDRSVLATDGPLASSPLVDGSVVTAGGPGPAPAARGSQVLAVVGGPFSGQIWPLVPGSTTVGRSSEADLRLDHESISRRHFSLVVESGTCTLEDLGSTNGTLVRGRAVSEPTVIGPGELIEAGACLFEVRVREERDADLRPDQLGGLAFNRPARIRPAPREVRVAFPGPPTEPEPQPFPWVQVIAPLVLALAAVLIFRRLEMLLFAAMSPVLVVSNATSSRRRERRRMAREMARFEKELTEAQGRIDEAAANEIERTRQQFPDPAALTEVATGPSRRLWERRAHDTDATVLRLGMADRPAAIAITSKSSAPAPNPPVLSDVPVTVDLATAGVLGIAGPPSEGRAVVRWLVAQLAILRSPRDVRLVVLTDPDARTDWDWVRWLPHVRDEDPQAPPALIGNDKLTREERVKELLKLLEARAAAARDLHFTTFSPLVVVVFDGIRALRSLPGVPRLLREGPAHGIHAIGLDTDVSRLAEEGRAQLVLDPDDPTLARLEVDGVEPVTGMLVDLVTADWADEVARALAPIRDVGGEEGETVIPRSVRFADLAGVNLDRTDDVVGRWALGGRSTEALIGVSADGPFSVDLRRDGPHALVAGTTGAGKSEFLQTLVVSLALVNRPTTLNFVLVDYKGASAFADCEGLPHTVGLVTNLDGHLTERALTSLDAELERRQSALRDFGVADIDTAWERDGAQAETAGLARLVIVVDEFAELVRDLPDFVSGLVRIARVGRSLGVHLILATQRPAGVVSAEMRTNTGLRVALRMEDKGDSSEVLGKPNAADISRATPGRGLVQIEGQAMLVEFQTARVAGRRKGSSEGLPPPRVERVPWARLGYPPPAAPGRVEKVGAATDLHALVAIIGAAADQLRVPRPHSPWLPPLPALLRLSQFRHAEPLDGEPVAVPIGAEDLPVQQTQRPATFDVVGGGHLLVAGSARSGRSQALRTLAGSLARTISPSDLHLYGLDFGNGALLPLADLPHCGAVVGRSETARAERLIVRLTEEVTRRQEILSRSGLGDITEQRAASPTQERLPYLMLLLDRWEGFTSQFSVDSGSEMPAAILRLLREGAGVGLRVVIAGDRSLLNDRLASQFEDKLVLRLADRDDYRSAGINPRSVPKEVRAGQAFRGESGREVQIAILGDDPSGQAQAAAVRHIAEEAERRWPAEARRNRPFRVDVMPTAIRFDQAWKLAETVRPASPLWAMVGVGGDELTAYGVDLAQVGAFVIGGPSKSGRSTALLTMARSLLAGGAQVVALCPRPSPLTSLDVAVLRGSPEGAEVTAALTAHVGPLAVIIDDAESLARTETDDALRDFLRSSGAGQVAVIVAGQIEELKLELRGTIVESRKAKTGLLLSPPSTLDGDLLGVRLPRSLVGRMPPGRGLLVSDGDVLAIQVPF